MDVTLRSFRHDRQLARFVITGEPTGKVLGVGSFGSVEEIRISGGLLCAGKKLHTILLDPTNIGVKKLVDRYVKECQLMSTLHHPNVVQFLGVCFLQDCSQPVLVMEKLEDNLHSLLEMVSNIPLVLKYVMLEDAARGLHYLHSHDIIHRDLTANNILLTSSLVAKISDLGNSRIVAQHTGQLAQTLSRYPGSLVYMPPEALTTSAKYGTSLDIFSFGHLALFTLTQVFSSNLLEATHNKNGRMLSRSEIERREEQFQYLQTRVGLPNGMKNPVVSMIIQCLDNDLSRRPKTQQLITMLEKIRVDTEGPHGDIAKMDAIRHVVTMRKLHKMNTEFKITQEENSIILKGKSDELLEKNEDIQMLRTELREKEAALQEKDEQLRRKELQLQELQKDLQKKDVLLKEKEDDRKTCVSIDRILLEEKTRELTLTQELLHQFQEAVKLQEETDHQNLTSSSESKICVSVIVGHSAEIRDEWSLGRRRNPFKWKIFVEGKGENDISSYVKEIVFHLHETFAIPMRIVSKPPYTFSATGWGQFISQVEFRFHNSEREKINYYITLPNPDESPLEKSETVHFCFQNPNEEFRKRLLQGGGIIVPRATSNDYQLPSKKVDT